MRHAAVIAFLRWSRHVQVGLRCFRFRRTIETLRSNLPQEKAKLLLQSNLGSWSFVRLRRTCHERMYGYRGYCLKSWRGFNLPLPIYTIAPMLPSSRLAIQWRMPEQPQAVVLMLQRFSRGLLCFASSLQHFGSIESL